MSDEEKKQQPFSLRRYVLLAVVLVLVARTVWRWPRTNWSLKPVSDISQKPKDTRPASSAKSQIRNVVLISLDTCRADRLGCYGYSRNTTPNIDSIAAEGITFNHAITPVPITLPAHSSMLTGTSPLFHKVHDNVDYHLNDKNLTLAEILSKNNFVTAAGIGAFVLDSQFGLDQGFDTYDDNLRGESKVFLGFNERKAEEVSHFAKTWLDKHHNEQFFLFLHYFDPHYPYEPHKDFPFASMPLLAFSKDHYDAEIAYTDHCIGQVIEKLKELKLYDNTLLIITADHGEAFGQHSESTHGYFIYHSTLHVPLIFRVPGGPENKRINNLASLIDIVPTVCALLGLPIPSQVQGKDFSGLFTQSMNPVDERYLYCESLLPTKLGFGPYIGLVNDRWKYIHTLEPELYDLLQHPLETKNIASKQSQQVKTMQGQLKSMLEKSKLGTIDGSKVTINEKMRLRLESLGYVGSKVNEDIEFDKSKIDAKKFIQVYSPFVKLMRLMTTEKLDKAKKVGKNLLTKWPDAILVRSFLGHIALREKNTKDAITHFSQYLAQIEPDINDFSKESNTIYQIATVHLNLGAALNTEGRTDEAIYHYRKALFYMPNLAKANHNLAGVYYRQDNPYLAIIYYTKALKADPSIAETHYHIARTYFRLGKVEKALIHYKKALALKPNWAEAQADIESAQVRKLELEKTTAVLNETLQKDPNNPMLHHKLAVVYMLLDTFDKALCHWDRALQLKPDWLVVLNNLAMLRATSENDTVRNPNEAAKLALRACELTNFNRPDFLNTLATVYAAEGKFDKAVETAQKALELALSANHQQLANNIKGYLDHYKANLKNY